MPSTLGAGGVDELAACPEAILTGRVVIYLILRTMEGGLNPDAHVRVYKYI